MKQIKKSWLFGGIATLAIAGVIGATFMKPMPVSVTEVAPKEVKLFFTEEGFVKDETTVDVYSLHSGAVVALYVKENQTVQAGDPICQIDASRLQHELETAKSNQKGFLSQINDLDLKEKQTKDELRISRNKLNGDYETILADENIAGNSYLSAEITKEEQLKLQNVIIEQNKTDLQNARDNLQKIETLYGVGAVSKQEAEEGRAKVGQLESMLEQNTQQLEVIKNSNEAQSRSVYYQSVKKSLADQIAGIDEQLSSTYNQAAKDYFRAQAESVESTVRLLEKQIDECTVKAPASGVITKLNINKSNVASAEAAVATITSGFEPLIEVYVPTSEIGSVHVGDTVELELKSDAGITYTGKVAEIDNKAIVQTSSLGVEKRKVKVTITPADEYVSFFKPGYDLTASFTTYYGKDMLTVPRTAVTYKEEEPVIWVVADGRAEQRGIEIERELKVEYVVKSGITEGEQVIKDAMASGLENGKKVNGDYNKK